MTNPALSPGVKLAWQVAGELALREKSEISPRQLLYGICSVEKLLKAPKDDAKDDLVSMAKPEVDRLHQLSTQHGFDFASLRRVLRLSSAAEQTSAAVNTGSQRVSRSLAARQLFEIAAQSASRAGLPQVDLPCLFHAALQVRDPEIESMALNLAQPQLNAIRQLAGTQSHRGQFALSIDTPLRDLDISRDSGPLQIAETVDASVPFELQKQTQDIEKLAALSELTWECGTRGQLDAMLQKAVDQLLGILGKGERGVILVRDAKDNELLLKACGPAGALPMISMTSAKRAIAQKKGFIWRRGEDLTLSQKQSNVETGMYVPLVVNGQSIGVICLDCFCPKQDFGRDDLLLVTSFAHQLALAIANQELQVTLQQNADVLERLLTNFSPKVRTRLLQRAQVGRLRLGGEQSVVSILCADIRGFARMTAGMPTDEVVALLNEYFAALTDCIFRNDGTVDKFVGDAILAVFGSPEEDPQHCRNAVLAGMDMQAAAREVSQRRKARGQVACEIGIGIHTGEVLHGFIGSPERMEFTIIGDAVNRASRYCDGAKGGQVLISPEINQRTWNVVEAQQVSIPTKHEGDLVAYRIERIKDRS